MSLVNQMLQDLQQRDASDSKPLAGLHAVPVRPQVAKPVNKRRRWLSALLLLSLFAVALLILRPQPDRVALPLIMASPAEPPLVESAKPSDVRPAVLPAAAPGPGTLASLATNQLDYILRAPPSRPRVFKATAKPERRAVVAQKMPSTEESAAAEALPPPETSIKKPVSAVAAMRLDGLAALRAGRPIEAEQQFAKLVAADSANPEAYLLLHAALRAQSRLAAARAILGDGLVHAGDTVQIARVLASELLADERINHALAVLTTHRPDDFADLSYEAQLAAVNQRAGDHETAIQLYQQLVGLHPGNAVWWVGLAISQEATGDLDNAQQSFAMATSNGTLEPTLARYAAERLAGLEAGS